MAVPFDHIASFDTLFTRSVIGQLQRKQVWNYLHRVTGELRGFEILELNCGASDDAMLFSERGATLVATDISEETLKITTVRANQYSMQTRVSSQFLDPDSFDETVFDKKFDLVFANFGGINCLHPDAVRRLLQKLPQILNTGGRFVSVIMPNKCLWESLYHLAHFRFRQAVQRNTNRESLLHLGSTSFKTWYYSPRQIKRWAAPHFNVVRILPIGFTTPSVSIESHFLHRKDIIFRLYRMGKKIGHLSFLSGISDNYLIDLKH